MPLSKNNQLVALQEIVAAVEAGLADSAADVRLNMVNGGYMFYAYNHTSKYSRYAFLRQSIIEDTLTVEFTGTIPHELAIGTLTLKATLIDITLLANAIVNWYSVTNGLVFNVSKDGDKEVNLVRAANVSALRGKGIRSE